MKKQVYEIDENGFLKEIYVAEVDENGLILDEDKAGFIYIDPPQGIYIDKAKWTGSEWIEFISAEERAEREAQWMLESLKPSSSDIADAELEIKILTLITEMGMI